MTVQIVYLLEVVEVDEQNEAPLSLSDPVAEQGRQRGTIERAGERVTHGGRFECRGAQFCRLPGRCDLSGQTNRVEWEGDISGQDA